MFRQQAHVSPRVEPWGTHTIYHIPSLALVVSGFWFASGPVA